jgi:hypothetical protein
MGGGRFAFRSCGSDARFGRLCWINTARRQFLPLLLSVLPSRRVVVRVARQAFPGV